MSDPRIINVSVCADCPFSHPKRSTCHHPEAKTVFAGARIVVRLDQAPPAECLFRRSPGAVSMIDGPRFVKLAEGVAA